MYIHEIFGWVDTSRIQHECLVDSIAFQCNLVRIKPVWDEEEVNSMSGLFDTKVMISPLALYVPLEKLLGLVAHLSRTRPMPMNQLIVHSKVKPIIRSSSYLHLLGL